LTPSRPGSRPAPAVEAVSADAMQVTASAPQKRKRRLSGLVTVNSSKKGIEPQEVVL
jgi:hypothetical protein